MQKPAELSLVMLGGLLVHMLPEFRGCLLYTSDAADERSSVDLGGRRIIKNKYHLKQSDAADDQLADSHGRRLHI